MKDRHKAPALLAAYALIFVAVNVIPNAFAAFMVGVVGGGMVLFNFGEQLAKDRERRRAGRGGQPG